MFAIACACILPLRSPAAPAYVSGHNQSLIVSPSVSAPSTSLSVATGEPGTEGTNLRYNNADTCPGANGPNWAAVMGAAAITAARHSGDSTAVSAGSLAVTKRSP